MKTHYDVLGVPHNADPETIKLAYRRLLKEHHPDLNDGDRAAQERAKAIIDAYTLLKDSDRRSDYDEKLRHRRRQRQRLVLITFLVSAGLASGATLAVLYSMLAPGKEETAARAGRPAPAQTAVASAEEVTESVPSTPREPPVAEPRPAPIGETPNARGENAESAVVADAAPTPAPKETPPRDIALAERPAAPEAPPPQSEQPAPPAPRAPEPQPAHPAHLHEADKLDPAALPKPLLDALNTPSAPETVTRDAPQQTPDAETPADTAPGNAPTSVSPVPPEADADARVAALDEAIRLNPGDGSARLQRADLLAAKGALPRALADYDAAIKLDVRSLAAFHRRGLLYRRLGATEKALADFDQAIRLSFSDARIYHDRGVLWYDKGNYDRALADLERAIKLDPRLASAHFHRGLALQRKGDRRSAAESFTVAVRLDPMLAAAHRAATTRVP